MKKYACLSVCDRLPVWAGAAAAATATTSEWVRWRRRASTAAYSVTVSSATTTSTTTACHCWWPAADQWRWGRRARWRRWWRQMMTSMCPVWRPRWRRLSCCSSATVTAHQLTFNTIKSHCFYDQQQQQHCCLLTVNVNYKPVLHQLATANSLKSPEK